MINFTKSDMNDLKNCLARILDHPTSFDKQKSIMGPNKFCLWCEEWEVIEMLKYLINGKEDYYKDPPPNRLKKSTLWSKEKIEEKVIRDLDAMTSVDQIVDYFKHKREHFNESV